MLVIFIKEENSQVSKDFMPSTGQPHTKRNHVKMKGKKETQSRDNF
jgi:hypothetical protein